MKKIFIVSTGRTGTQFLANFFSKNFNYILSVHEPFPSRHFRILSNMFSAGIINKKILILIFKLTRKKLLKKNTEFTYYIESNNFLYGYSGLFKEIYTDYKVVHIVRDPRDYIKSHLNHGVFKGKKLLAKKFVPFWFLNVKKGMGIKGRLTSYQELAYRYNIVNSYIEESCKNDKNYKVFRYEDLFGENSAEYLTQLTKFIELPETELDLEANYEKMNQGKMKVAKNWKSWAIEDINSVNRICKDFIVKYNY